MNVEKVVKLKGGEEVLGIARNHWITRLWPFLGACVLFFVPFFFMVPLFRFGIPGVVAFGACALLGLILGTRIVFLRYWNAFIVTTARVIDIDQRGFFTRTVSEAPYAMIQDVSFSFKGILGALFGYGAVTIQTAGNAANLELPHVADPKEMHHVITEMLAEFRGASAAPESAGRSPRVSQLLEAATELNDAEARAFLTSIQQAVVRKEEKPAPDVDGFMRDASALADDDGDLSRLQKPDERD